MTVGCSCHVDMYSMPYGEDPLIRPFLSVVDPHKIHGATLASRLFHLPVLDAAFRKRERRRLYIARVPHL
jgi:uncharacterized membrane protein YcfT